MTDDNFTTTDIQSNKTPSRFPPAVLTKKEIKVASTSCPKTAALHHLVTAATAVLNYQTTLVHLFLAKNIQKGCNAR
ncbi:hypothetical protein L3X38_014935 [Prunus dulcis]|nr:hypothetical protein L3X38_014935 [Prunus dulcis]